MTCFIGIGSNLGNRKAKIRQAVQKINQLPGTRVIRISPLIETKPMGGPAAQRNFLNACLKLKTRLKPLALLSGLQKIEQDLGRPKKHIRFGARTIDLDILFYADRRIKNKRLRVPHPRIFAREFVVRPLLEVL